LNAVLPGSLSADNIELLKLFVADPQHTVIGMKVQTPELFDMFGINATVVTTDRSFIVLNSNCTTGPHLELLQGAPQDKAIGRLGCGCLCCFLFMLVFP
jgi:hypothetical protein